MLIFIYPLLLPEGQMDEASKYFSKGMIFQKLGIIG
jgi:hypothetical protein